MTKQRIIRINSIREGALYDITTKDVKTDTIDMITIALGNRAAVQFNKAMIRTYFTMGMITRRSVAFKVECDGLDGLYPLHLKYVKTYDWHDRRSFILE